MHLSEMVGETCSERACANIRTLSRVTNHESWIGNMETHLETLVSCKTISDMIYDISDISDIIITNSKSHQIRPPNPTSNTYHALQTAYATATGTRSCPQTEPAPHNCTHAPYPCTAPAPQNRTHAPHPHRRTVPMYRTRTAQAYPCTAPAPHKRTHVPHPHRTTVPTYRTRTRTPPQTISVPTVVGTIDTDPFTALKPW